MTSMRLIALAAASAFAVAACGHDKTYVVEKESEPAVVERTTVVESAPAASPTTVQVSIAPEQAQIVREYYVERGCPAGLVQQGTSCVAPGVVTHRYVVGQPLPQDVVVVELPGDLVTRLPALPANYDYRIIDGDLAIVDRSSLVVIDADALD